MKKLLFLALLAGLLWYLMLPQWRSFDRMGARRTQALARLPKELQVGVMWPFSVNQDGMADGLQLARDEINADGLAAGIPIRLILREGLSWEHAKQIAIEFSSNPNMSAVLGYYDDSEAIKASTMYESSGLLHLIVGVNSSAMTAQGSRYIVRTIQSSEKIARLLARLLADQGHRKYALIYLHTTTAVVDRAALERIELILADNSVYPFRGRFTNIARAVDEKTGTLLVVAQFPNAKGILLPGMTGGVRLADEKRPDAVLVSERTLFDAQGSRAVYIVTPGSTVSLRNVVNEGSYQGKSIVTKGLGGGEKVIVEGIAKVRPGQSVTTQTAQAVHDR